MKSELEQALDRLNNAKTAADLAMAELKAAQEAYNKAMDAAWGEPSPAPTMIRTGNGATLVIRRG